VPHRENSNFFNGLLEGIYSFFASSDKHAGESACNLDQTGGHCHQRAGALAKKKRCTEQKTDPCHPLVSGSMQQGSKPADASDKSQNQYCYIAESHCMHLSRLGDMFLHQVELLLKGKIGIVHNFWR